MLKIVRGVEFWNRYARKYAEYMRRRRMFFEQRVEKLAKLLGFDRNTTVLEIGAGPGTYTVPIAKRVKLVTAIEPAEAMVKELTRYAQEEGVDNIRVVVKRWEDIAPGTDVDVHDIVFAAHSLVMDDLRSAISKMFDLAKRSICIVTHASRSRWMEIYINIIRELIGSEAFARSKRSYSDMVEVIRELGYEPIVITEEITFVELYRSLDEVVEDWMDRIRARVEGSIDEEKLRDRIREALKSIAEYRENGVAIRYDYSDAIIVCHKKKTL